MNLSLLFSICLDVKVYYMVEFDLPKGRERLEDYWKYMSEKVAPMLVRMDNEKFYTGFAFADNTGHIVWMFDFEDTDAFNLLWNDKEWHSVMSSFAQLVDNLSYRKGRPVIMPD
jgi:hypothetical protein